MEGIVLDSYQAYNYMPLADFGKLLTKVQSSVTNCVNNADSIQCDCTSSDNLDTKFPSWTLQVGDTSSAELTFSGASYMYYDTNLSKCNSYFRILNSLSASKYWLMGLPFYRAFDITHDLHDKRLGFKANGNTASGVVKGAGVALANAGGNASGGFSMEVAIGSMISASVALLFA